MTSRIRTNKIGRRGFSLMELLVVLGIFSAVVASASDIFMLATRSQRKVFALERTQADARFTMEAIAREVRTGSIDYAHYGDKLQAPGPADELALIDSTGQPIRFFKSDDPATCADTESAPCLLVAIGGGSPAAITPKGVKVYSAAFYLMPKADPGQFDPASGSFAADVQPHVTVVLVMESTVQDPRERSVVYMQTTVENRGYKR